MTNYFWLHIQSISAKKYVCSYCNTSVASDRGYRADTGIAHRHGYLYICPLCTQPSFIDGSNIQTPGTTFGTPILHITNKSIEQLYEEGRKCFSINAYTSTVMCCRKLLMNIAVTEGATEGNTFANYVDYLASNNYIPPHARQWIDKIRTLGNEANHSIEFKTQEEALLILRFTEMLLKLIYEMPGLLNNHQSTN